MEDDEDDDDDDDDDDEYLISEAYNTYHTVYTTVSLRTKSRGLENIEGNRNKTLIYKIVHFVCFVQYTSSYITTH